MSFDLDDSQKRLQKCALLLHHSGLIVSHNSANDIFNDRLKVGRVTSLKKVYSNVQTFFMNLYEGESSENRKRSRTRINRIPRSPDP